MAQPNTFVVPADLDIPGAQAKCEALLEAISTAEDGWVRVELDGERPTQIALQILFATHALVGDTSAPVEFGARASELLKLAETASGTMENP